MPKLKLAIVCSSNQNRSMEAHYLLSKKGFNVQSFGTGANVKLPGSAPDKPNVYEFGKTSYDEMYKELKHKDKDLYPIVCFTPRFGVEYTQNGILNMLDRNRRIKLKPERFQNCPEEFDVVITVEERVYDQVLDDFNNRTQESSESVHVINVDIQDNHDEATLGAFLIYELCQLLEESDDLDNDLDDILQNFETRADDRTVLHSICFY